MPVKHTYQAEHTRKYGFLKQVGDSCPVCGSLSHAGSVVVVVLRLGTARGWSASGLRHDDLEIDVKVHWSNALVYGIDRDHTYLVDLEDRGSRVRGQLYRAVLSGEDVVNVALGRVHDRTAANIDTCIHTTLLVRSVEVGQRLSRLNHAVALYTRTIFHL